MTTASDLALEYFKISNGVTAVFMNITPLQINGLQFAISDNIMRHCIPDHETLLVFSLR